MFNEAALQRFDLVLSEAAKNGIKVIFPMVDGDNYLGGPQWYFDQARTAVIKHSNVKTRRCLHGTSFEAINCTCTQWCPRGVPSLSLHVLLH